MGLVSGTTRVGHVGLGTVGTGRPGRVGIGSLGRVGMVPRLPVPGHAPPLPVPGHAPPLPGPVLDPWNTALDRPGSLEHRPGPSRARQFDLASLDDVRARLGLLSREFWILR